MNACQKEKRGRKGKQSKQITLQQSNFSERTGLCLCINILCKSTVSINLPSIFPITDIQPKLDTPHQKKNVYTMQDMINIYCKIINHWLTLKKCIHFIIILNKPNLVQMKHPVHDSHYDNLFSPRTPNNQKSHCIMLTQTHSKY